MEGHQCYLKNSCLTGVTCAFTFWEILMEICGCSPCLFVPAPSLFRVPSLSPALYPFLVPFHAPSLSPFRVPSLSHVLFLCPYHGLFCPCHDLCHAHDDGREIGFSSLTHFRMRVSLSGYKREYTTMTYCNH